MSDDRDDDQDTALDTPSPREGEALLDDIFAEPVDGDDFHADVLLSVDDGDDDDEDRETEVKARAWDESKHKRGQPGNKGQFGPGGGGATNKDKGKGKKTAPKKPAPKGKKGDKPVEIPADLTPYEEGAGATYSTRDINKTVKKKHDKQFSVLGQTTENEKTAKRISTKKKGAYISPNQYLLLKQKAATKIMHIANHKDHVPTKKEIKEAKAGIKEYGSANAYRRILNGSSKDRRNRKIALAAEFGDGKRCGCVYCGTVISFSPKYSSQPMDEDKIHDTASGGKYKHQNLLPACIPCNRGDKKAKNSLQFLKTSKYGQTHLPSSPDNPKYKPPKTDKEEK